MVLSLYSVLLVLGNVSSGAGIVVSCSHVWGVMLVLGLSCFFFRYFRWCLFWGYFEFCLSCLFKSYVWLFCLVLCQCPASCVCVFILLFLILFVVTITIIIMIDNIISLLLLLFWIFTFWGLFVLVLCCLGTKDKQTEEMPRKPTSQLCLVDFVVGVACSGNLMCLLWLCCAVCRFGWFIVNLLLCPCVLIFFS